MSRYYRRSRRSGGGCLSALFVLVFFESALIWVRWISATAREKGMPRAILYVLLSWVTLGGSCALCMSQRHGPAPRAPAVAPSGPPPSVSPDIAPPAAAPVPPSPPAPKRTHHLTRLTTPTSSPPPP